MAGSATRASSMGLAPLQIGWLRPVGWVSGSLERWLDAERDQLFLWLPIMLGAGIACWFVLPDERSWTVSALIALGIAVASLAAAGGGRAARVFAIAALVFVVGIGLIWWRAVSVSAPVLKRPVIATIEARVERIERLPARELVRLRLAPSRVVTAGGQSPAGLPGHVRVNLAEADFPVDLSRGATIRLSVRLLPPPAPSVPGAYDFARVAWFDRIGATGRGSAPVTIISLGEPPGGALRARLSAHILSRLSTGPGAIAAALATGDQGAIPVDDAEAMRRAGLAHLLSVSGLHITAVVGGVMFAVLRLLALSRWLALRVRLPLIAAGAAAAAAIGYTLLTGAEVPTVRSCVAALMVLIAIALGREAVTLRLVAVGAIIVLLAWPEAIAGPSFQLSFAAVASIITLHEAPPIRAFFGPHEEARWRRVGRQLLSLLMTGIVVEAALAPIALFHFHKAGLYGSVANIAAIPLTTFVIMPAEAMALALDTIGLGAPAWWVVDHALALLLWIAHRVAAAPGAVATLPELSTGAFALMAGGGIWLCLCRTRWRALGLIPIAAGAGMAIAAPTPDLLVTGDGRHLAIRTDRGDIAILRDRTGDYNRAMLAENGGVDGEPLLLSTLAEARCSADLCLIERKAGGRRWRILATRSPYRIDAGALIAACRSADIVVTDRRLPRRCSPRWLLLDRQALSRTGGVAVTLSTGHVTTVRTPGDRHPWRVPPTLPVSRSDAAARRASPAPAPGADRNAAGHKRGSPDRAGSSRLRDENI